MRYQSGNTQIFMLIGGGLIGLIIGIAGTAALTPEDEEITSTDSTTMQMEMMEMNEVDSDTDGVTVGGAKMVRTLDIVDNAANADNVTTVVSLVQLADLVDTLKSPGPFTVFGPNNAAFAKLPEETVEAVQQPENKELLQTILTYHVVPATYTTADLRVMANEGMTLTTVQGEELTPIIQGGQLGVRDVTGAVSMIETADVISSNGVTHVIDTVLMPQ